MWAAVGMVIEFEVSGPAKWWNANQRIHFHERATRVKAWRDAGRQAWLGSGHGPMKRAHVFAYVKFRDRRRHDAGNWYPTAKACIDGMIDAGMLPDDSDAYLIGPDMRPHPDASPMPVIVFKIHPVGTRSA
jgi:crossover junction endodeoxyribonuclease RusA